MVNPYFIIGAMIAVGGAYGYGHHVGWGDRDAEMQVEIAKKNEESREKERELAQQLNDQSTKLSEANNVINQKQSALDRAIRSGRVRISAPSCVQASASATITAPDSKETGSQSDRPADPAPDAERETLQAIAEIVAQGDRNTAQLNACIDAYNEARDLINGKR